MVKWILNYIDRIVQMVVYDFRANESTMCVIRTVGEPGVLADG